MCERYVDEPKPRQQAHPPATTDRTPHAKISGMENSTIGQDSLVWHNKFRQNRKQKQQNTRIRLKKFRQNYTENRKHTKSGIQISRKQKHGKVR